MSRWANYCGIKFPLCPFHTPTPQTNNGRLSLCICDFVFTALIPTAAAFFQNIKHLCMRERARGPLLGRTCRLQVTSHAQRCEREMSSTSVFADQYASRRDLECVSRAERTVCDVMGPCSLFVCFDGGVVLLCVCCLCSARRSVGNFQLAIIACW